MPDRGSWRRGLAVIAFPLSLALSYPRPATAAALDDAVALVLAAHPVLIAGRDELRAQERQRDWSSTVSIGWTQRGTDYGGEAGPNAGFRVSIPLFDRSNEIKTAKARTAWQKDRNAVLKAFLSDVEKLCAKAATARAMDTMRAFYRDRLDYRRQQVDEGLAEADTLWAEAEKVQKAEHDYRRELGELETLRESVARQYGGDQWKTLRDLLAEHEKRTQL